MGDHLQIKGDPIEDFDIGHHKSAHNLHGTYFLSLRVLTILRSQKLVSVVEVIKLMNILLQNEYVVK